MSLNDMINKAKQLQENIQHLKAQGQSGAGLVKLEINGRHELENIDIDLSLLNPDQKEVLEDLIRAALNNANANLESSLKTQMQSLTGGLKLPF